MAWTEVIWNDGPDGNIEHLAQNGVTPDEVDHVLENPTDHGVSQTSGHPIVFGYTAGGRFLAVVILEYDEITVYPITAFDVED